MMRVIAGLVVGVWAISCSNGWAAEGGTPLEELLVDKGVISQEEAASVQRTRVAAWLDQITVGGDIRLRQEMFYRQSGIDDRSRQRFRLRLGAELQIDTVLVGFRLASGTGEHTSTNKTFDNLSAQTPLYIDRAFVQWQGENSRWLTLTGGRMPNPFFTVYSSDLVWDDDFNPEGLAENVTFSRGGADLFVNVAQIVLDEDSSGNLSTDQWLYVQQVGVKANPTTMLQTVLAVTYLNAVNSQNNNLGQATCADGNSRAMACAAPLGDTGTLINDYNVWAVTAQVNTKVGSLPVSVMGDAVKNTADTKSAVGGVDTKDGGYQAGLILGKASGPQTWEAAYFYKKVGADATLADIADSDFGVSGGTNRKGHITWIAYNHSKALQVKVKYATTHVEDAATAAINNGGDNGDVNRLQCDLSVKF